MSESKFDCHKQIDPSKLNVNGDASQGKITIVLSALDPPMHRHCNNMMLFFHNTGFYRGKQLLRIN